MKQIIPEEINTISQNHRPEELFMMLERELGKAASECEDYAKEYQEKIDKIDKLNREMQNEIREYQEKVAGEENTIIESHRQTIYVIQRKLADVTNAQDNSIGDYAIKKTHRIEELLKEKRDILKKLEELYKWQLDEENKSIQRETDEKRKKDELYNKTKEGECVKQVNLIALRESEEKETLEKAIHSDKEKCLKDMLKYQGIVLKKYADDFVNEEICKHFQSEWKIWQNIRQNDIFHKAEDLPERMPIGLIGTDINKAIGMNDDIAHKMISHLRIYQDMGAIDEKGKWCIPYCVNRKKNIGVYINVDITRFRNEILNLAFQQLAAFPLGKIELLSIDTENSRLFTPLMQLIKGQDKRMIGGQEWSEENDIERELKDAYEHLKNLSSYEDQDKREKRENFKLIVISGFPYNFSHKALESLEHLVSDGRSYGMGFILIESREKRRMPLESQELIKRIREKIDNISEQGGDLHIRMQSIGDISYCFKFGECPSLDSIKEMIEEMARGISEYIRTPLNVMEINDEAFTDVWSSSTIDGIEIPFGRSYDKTVSLVLGRSEMTDIRHHVVIEGSTGSGKSKLLQTIVTSAIYQYDPSELEVYYLDYKNSMQSSIYSRYELPSFRAVTVNSEREFGLAVLRRVRDINIDREETIRDAKVDLINDYRKLPNAERMPKILLVIDELSEFLSAKDHITEEALDILLSLVRTGRAEGIHVILASQTIDLPEDIMANVGVRIALNGSGNILDISDEEANRYFKEGMHAVFNDHKGTSKNEIGVRNAYIADEHEQLLEKLERIALQDEYAEAYGLSTKILYTQLEQNRKHTFNTMKFSQNTKKGRTPMYIGECFEFEQQLGITVRQMQYQNFLVVGQTAEQLLQTFFLMILSALHDELNKEISNRNIWFIDMNDGEEKRKNINMLIESFPEEICYVSIGDDEEDADSKSNAARNFINEIYQIVVKRESVKDSGEEPFFLFIYGAEYLDFLEPKRAYQKKDLLFNEPEDRSLGCFDKLHYIIERGSQSGVHVVLSTLSYELTEENLGKNYEEQFDLRILYGAVKTDKGRELAKKLVKDEAEIKRSPTVGIYYDVSSMRKRKIFRRYDYPKADWIRQYRSRYEKVRERERR